MAQRSFQAQINEWVRETKERIEAVRKTAAQSVIEEIIERTPVDTGYLRASLTVTLNQPMPARADARPGGSPVGGGQPYALTINSAKLQDAIYASFVANYARHVEYGARGRAPVRMVGLAVQNWQQHVDRAAATVRSRVASR